jgi:hypothetical protein
MYAKLFHTRARGTRCQHFTSNNTFLHDVIGRARPVLKPSMKVSAADISSAFSPFFTVDTMIRSKTLSIGIRFIVNQSLHVQWLYLAANGM